MSLKMIDFLKLNASQSQPPTTDPRSIFQSLTKARPEKYEYPRDVQAEVWAQWHERRDERDLVLKLNTGGGKTTVGLCILQSCLNEKKGPAVYVAPNNFLVDQVMTEAQELGIKVTDDVQSGEFISGEAIYVCNTYKVVNGKSIFGVKQRKIDVGSIVFDDAHACIGTITDQFTINIPSTSLCYTELLNLFVPVLQHQSQSQTLSIQNGDPHASLEVPYWAWQQALTNVHQIFSAFQNDDILKWQYPLVNDHLDLCNCIVASNKIEISTPIIPLEVIPSIAKAQRKIFMTATLSDDSILSSHFGVKRGALGSPITPSKAGDIGERMILAPQEINTEFTEVTVRHMCKQLAIEQNVVVIVPSSKRAKLWEGIADRILEGDNVAAGIAELKTNPRAGITVMVNRYDGIDLPGDACRVLVIDGLPEYRSLAQKTEEIELMDSSLGNRDLIHKVEQGMGRGVRSNSDYCVVLLIGTDLISKLYLQQAIKFFSPGTRVQLELSRELTKQIRAESPTVESLLEVMSACLKRDDGWRKVAAQRLLGLTFESEQKTDGVITSIREAYDLYFSVQTEAIPIIEEIPRLGSFDPYYKGYLKQIVAQYLNRMNPEAAQKTQQSAIKLNKALLKPIHGIERKPADRSAMDQSLNAEKYLSGKYPRGNDLILGCESIINDLQFSEVGSSKYERALADAGKFIGFESQQPDREEGTGPDVFWFLGSEWGLLIECKSEATTSAISKDYCNQLSGHVSWHDSLYGNLCKPPIPVMNHPSSLVDDVSSVPKNMHFLNGEGLDKFKKALHDFAVALAGQSKYRKAPEIYPLLREYSFLHDRFVAEYLRPFR